MSPGGSWDPRGVQRTLPRELTPSRKNIHTLRRCFHTKIQPNRSSAATFRALDLLPESALRAGSRPHATPIGARTTAVHLVNALGGKKARSRCARGIQLPLALLSSSHLIDPRPDAASQIKHSAYSAGAFASSLRRSVEGIIKAVERRFLPARRCVVAALPPSLPAAKLVFALCAAFRPAGGRGAAAEAQGMRPGCYGSGLSRQPATCGLHAPAHCARARLSEHVCFRADRKEPVSALHGPPWAPAPLVSTV